MSENLKDELAGLAEAVRELCDREVADEIRNLRAEIEKLRAERSGHHCHGCGCTHINWNYWPLPAAAPVYSATFTVSTSGTNPPVTTVSNVTAPGAAGMPTSTYLSLASN